MNSELVKLLIELLIRLCCDYDCNRFDMYFHSKACSSDFKKTPSSLGESPERVEENNAGDVPSVRGPYDAQEEKYDLNYKIYHKDIYGVDFKHGKEKRKKWLTQLLLWMKILQNGILIYAKKLSLLNIPSVKGCMVIQTICLCYLGKYSENT